MNERIEELIALAEELADDEHGKLVEQNTPNLSWVNIYSKTLAELIIEKFSYDLMNIHAATPERVQLAAKTWGVEV